jgi:hypothetical protein
MGSMACLDSCGKHRPHRDLMPGPSNWQRVTIASALSRSTFVKGTGCNADLGVDALHCRTLLSSVGMFV